MEPVEMEEEEEEEEAGVVFRLTAPTVRLVAFVVRLNE